MRTPTLLYDADCGFCTRSAEFLKRRRPACDVVAQTPAVLTGLNVDPARAATEIPFVDAAGRVTWGAEAIADALATTRGPWRLAGRALRTPPALALARPVYAWVASHRHELPGGTASCRLPD